MSKTQRVPLQIYQENALTSLSTYRWYESDMKLVSGNTTKERLNELDEEIRAFHEQWDRCSKTEDDRIGYKNAVATLTERKEDLMAQIKRCLIDMATEGHIIGMGFVSPADSAPQIIPPNHWPFLEIDFIKGDARGTNRSYVGVRFIGVNAMEGLKRLWEDEAALDEILLRFRAAGIKEDGGDQTPKKTEGKIQTPEQGRELAAARFCPEYKLKEKARQEALWFIEGGKFNHKEITNKIEEKPGFESLTRPQILNVVRKACADQGRNDLIFGHPESRSPK